jgi:hypothetical protein
MTNVAEELSPSETDLTREHVLRRVDDWQRRINDLYDMVLSWLPADIVVDRSGTIVMHEELMRHFSIAPVRLPVLSLSKGDAWIGKLVPQGLWIIGTNGRVDLVSTAGRALLIDRSEIFASSLWSIAPSEHRRRTEALDEASFRKALGL